MTPYQDALEKLEALYSMIPDVHCQGLCAHACGPLAVSQLERVRLQRQTGRKLQGLSHYACPLLREGRCTVYAARPLLCRLYASTEAMRCRYGCMPDRLLTVSEQDALLRAVEEVSQAIYPGKGTVSFHTDATIVQAQEQTAAQLCQVLWGVR